MRQTGSIVLCTMLLFTIASPAHGGATVKPGIDVLATDGFKPLVGKRVGLITNPTGMTADMRSTIDVLYEAPEVNLVALYGPEHGVRGDVYAGDHVVSDKDAKTGLPVHSLYGKLRKPTAEVLEGIKVLVFDIQDIGARSYTFISTLATSMEAAAELGIEYVVLDRPNPLGGERMEGRVLTDMNFKSFIGYLPVPYLHGMTVGELAKMINGEGWIPDGRKCKLTVIPMQGWRRDMQFAETGLFWAPSSPHVVRAEASMFYAATGIMGELHAINEGVGYPLPFELCGAPEFDAQKLASHMNGLKMPGVTFRPLYYKPYYGTHKKNTCGGVQVYITDPDNVHLTSIQFHVMDYARQKHPEIKLFGSKRDNMFDKACGTNEIRKMFIDGKPIAEILKYWDTGMSEFGKQRAPYLIYK